METAAETYAGVGTETVIAGGIVRTSLNVKGSGGEAVIGGASTLL